MRGGAAVHVDDADLAVVAALVLLQQAVQGHRCGRPVVEVGEREALVGDVGVGLGGDRADLGDRRRHHRPHGQELRGHGHPPRLAVVGPGHDREGHAAEPSVRRTADRPRSPRPAVPRVLARVVRSNVNDPMQRGLGGHARRSADRRRRLPRPERRDPGGGPQGRHASRLRVRRVPRRLAGTARGRDDAAGHQAVPGDPAPRRHHPRLLAHQPVQDRRRRRADPGEPRRGRGRRAGRHRRRGHPRGRHQAGRPGRQRGRRPEDHRQRPVRHRLHVRLRHRRQHRHRGDRPAAHHRRVPPPGAGGGGDGPARRLDRPARRHRRRCQRGADPGAAVRHRGRLRPRRGAVPDPATRRSSWSPRARCRSRAAT